MNGVLTRKCKNCKYSVDLARFTDTLAQFCFYHNILTSRHGQLMSYTKQAKLPTKNVIQGTLFATPAQLRQWSILKPTTVTTPAPPQSAPAQKGEAGETSGGVAENKVMTSIFWIKKLLQVIMHVSVTQRGVYLLFSSFEDLNSPTQ
ncbi:hypothetical protein JTE90_026126 [Oedothorax gibbosus]|uniref:Uncharacterized protein n=1 Tax=Oedothorax gibbosus TaxID=931172 RepID=A0AAV6V1E6_9ARAC|nr:hypothetical protein JTE90_026126 [Oedothorax gibbosus]